MTTLKASEIRSIQSVAIANVVIPEGTKQLIDQIDKKIKAAIVDVNNSYITYFHEMENNEVVELKIGTAVCKHYEDHGYNTSVHQTTMDVAGCETPALCFVIKW